MSLHKSTQFLSEIAMFFKNNDATRAFSAHMLLDFALVGEKGKKGDYGLKTL